MSFSLLDFGYDGMAPHGSAARGERPLPVALCTLSGNPANPFADPYQIFGYNRDPKWPNVKDYFLAVSSGRFTWRSAADTFFNVALSAEEFAKPIEQRLPAIYSAVKSQGFDFGAFDVSPRDGEICHGELSILVVDNGTSGGGRSGDDGAAILVGNRTIVDEDDIGYSFVATPNSLSLKAHELAHTLGTIDLYGPDGDPWNQKLNTATSLMGDYPNRTMSCHLDPWHKMRLGWIEPAIIELSTRRPVFLHAAGQNRSDATAILFHANKAPLEYFMIEFRNNHPDVAGTYDQDAYDTGLVVWHIKTDYSFDPIRELVKGQGDYRGVFYLGQPPAGHIPLPNEVDPNFARGKGKYWHSGEVTPQLTWYNGRPSGIRISVRTFAADAKGIFRRHP